MTTDEVVGWLLGRGHADWLDDSGRPLGEAASKHYRDVPQSEQVRSFGDARDASGLPCNMAALMQLQGNWGAIGAWLSGFEHEAPATMGRLARRANAGTRLAPLVAARTSKPVSQFLAALYKSMLGYNELALAMLLEGRVRAEDPVPDTATFDKWLDERPWLIGDIQVCAGTRTQIRRMWSKLGETGEASEAKDSMGRVFGGRRGQRTRSRSGETRSRVLRRESRPSRGAKDSMDKVFGEWFLHAHRAGRELDALVASAAGAARMATLRGRQVGPVATALYLAAVVPRSVFALRQAPDAGPMHPSLLYEPDSVPESLRTFIEAVMQGVDVDEALLSAATEPTTRLIDALDLEKTSLTLAAFTPERDPSV